MAERRSPLAHLAADLEAASSPQLRIAERPFLAQVGVRVRDEESARARVAAALGGALPAIPGTVAPLPGGTALWLGPDEWLVLGAPGEEEGLLPRLTDALGGGAGAAIDLSANRTAIELSGASARTVLEKGCSIDLHPRAFGPGRCAQTMVARAQVILEQLTDEPAYRLLVRPSFAAYLAAWLMDAAMEFRADPSESRSSIERRQRSVRATSLNV